MEEVALELGWIWIWREVGCAAGRENSVVVEGVPPPQGKASGPCPFSGDEWGCAQCLGGACPGNFNPVLLECHLRHSGSQHLRTSDIQSLGLCVPLLTGHGPPAHPVLTPTQRLCNVPIQAVWPHTVMGSSLPREEGGRGCADGTVAAAESLHGRHPQAVPAPPPGSSRQLNQQSLESRATPWGPLRRQTQTDTAIPVPRGVLK